MGMAEAARRGIGHPGLKPAPVERRRCGGASADASAGSPGRDDDESSIATLLRSMIGLVPESTLRPGKVDPKNWHIFGTFTAEPNETSEGSREPSGTTPSHDLKCSTA